MLTDDLVKHDEPQMEMSGNIDIDLKAISSIALARLVEEVRNDEGVTSRSYDRAHNRHNR